MLHFFAAFCCTLFFLQPCTAVSVARRSRRGRECKSTVFFVFLYFFQKENTNRLFGIFIYFFSFFQLFFHFITATFFRSFLLIIFFVFFTFSLMWYIAVVNAAHSITSDRYALRLMGTLVGCIVVQSTVGLQISRDPGFIRTNNDDIDQCNAVSYTHLTLPTILRV